jgi:5,10-methylenetetrahydromethanopterin reductase
MTIGSDSGSRFSGLGLSLSNEESAAATLALVRDADRLGFDEVSLPESRRHRSVIAMAAAALVQTEQVVVRIGIANPVTRHPVVLAMEAATLEDLGPGRVRFGIGAAEWTVKALGWDPEGWKPYTNTVEAVRAVKRLTAGQSLGFEPSTFLAPADTVLDLPSPAPVPVDIGAVNKRMMEAVGEVADGVQLGAITSVAYTRWAVDRIAAGAKRAGRDGRELLVTGNVLTSVGESRAKARGAVREVLAYYLARVEGVVVDLAAADLEAVAAVRTAVAERGVEVGAKTVSESLIDTFAVAGTVEEVVDGLLAFADAGMHVPLLWHTLGPDPTKAVEVLARDVRPAIC